MEVVKVGKVEHYSIKSGNKTIGILTLSPKWDIVPTGGGFEIIHLGPAAETEEQEVQIVGEVKKEKGEEKKCTCGIIDDFYLNTFNCHTHGKGVKVDVRAPPYVPPTPSKSREVEEESKVDITIDCKMKVWKWLENQSDDE